jgi:Leucine-rich repeat (LRR) protein
LRANRLVALPANIGDLPKLKKLDLRWNKLSSLPAWLRRLEERGCSIYL